MLDIAVDMTAATGELRATREALEGMLSRIDGKIHTLEQFSLAVSTITGQRRLLEKLNKDDLLSSLVSRVKEELGLGSAAFLQLCTGTRAYTVEDMCQPLGALSLGEGCEITCVVSEQSLAAGTYCRLRGLKKSYELNGSIVKVLDCKKGGERFEVRATDTGQIFLARRENMDPLVSWTPAMGAGAAGLLSVGSTVRLEGLRTTTQYNHLDATVSSIIEPDGRVKVVLKNGRSFAVSGHNLALVTCIEAADREASGCHVALGGGDASKSSGVTAAISVARAVAHVACPGRGRSQVRATRGEGRRRRDGSEGAIPEGYPLQWRATEASSQGFGDVYSVSDMRRSDVSPPRTCRTHFLSL